MFKLLGLFSGLILRTCTCKLICCVILDNSVFLLKHFIVNDILEFSLLISSSLTYRDVITSVRGTFYRNLLLSLYYFLTV